MKLQASGSNMKGHHGEEKLQAQVQPDLSSGLRKFSGMGRKGLKAACQSQPCRRLDLVHF